MQFTLTDLWHHMGLFARLIVGVLAVMSILSLFAAGERWLTLRKAKKQSLQFARKMGDQFAQGGMEAAASVDVGQNTGYLGRVIAQGLEAYRSTRGADPDLVFESVSRALERQAQREVQGMKRGQGILGTVSSTAPFVGLLGTVMGIVNSFQMMAASGSGGLATVSAGIAEALVTTAFGLLVAIPAVMTYNFFQGWIEARTVDIAESSNELLDVLARHLAGPARPASVHAGPRVQAR
ncbi:MAG TPA: MotA/TolQ/ExbB proton channel family protein [Polyangiaceae bacterium]